MAYDPTIPALENYIGDDIPKIMANFGELAGSRIVDHNLDVPNPPNGYYVRWENGLQVCWHSEVRRFAIQSGPADGFYWSSVSWSFPSAFSACHYANMIVRTFPRVIFSALADTQLPVTNKIGFNACCQSQVAETDMQLGFIAIGEWK